MRIETPRIVSSRRARVMLELKAGIFEGQSSNCLKRKYIDSRSSETKDKRNRSERVPLDELLPRTKKGRAGESRWATRMA
jgi:hypothetical protein